MAKPTKPQIIRRDRPQVLVMLGHSDALRAIVKLAREWEWDLLDLGLTRGTISDDRLPSGAFVCCLPSDPLVKRLREMNCPAVRMGHLPHPQDNLLPAVLPDVAAAGRSAADHFAARGFKHVAFVGYDPLNPDADFHASFTAFHDRSNALGLPCHLHSFRPTTKEGEPNRYERRTRELGQWLEGVPKPVGILTAGDYLAARICTMCRAVGVVVPEQVALLGVGNNELTCELSPVALSSIDPNEAEQGRQVAYLLRSLMAGQAAPEAPILVPPRGVVTRRSTEVLAVSDLVVARAIRFMWDHLEQNPSVADVAKEVGLPRRTLERAFREHVGRGLNAEMRRKRLERCCELLKTTHTPIIDLAPLLGFRSADYLHTCFRRAFGTTPRRWRVQQNRNVP